MDREQQGETGDGEEEGEGSEKVAVAQMVGEVGDEKHQDSAGRPGAYAG